MFDFFEIFNLCPKFLLSTKIVNFFEKKMLNEIFCLDFHWKKTRYFFYFFIEDLNFWIRDFNKTFREDSISGFWLAAASPDSKECSDWLLVSSTCAWSSADWRICFFVCVIWVANAVILNSKSFCNRSEVFWKRSRNFAMSNSVLKFFLENFHKKVWQFWITLKN